MFNKKNIKWVHASIIFVLALVVIYVSFGIYSYSVVSKYDNRIYPNVYVNDYEISGKNKSEVYGEIEKLEKMVGGKSIVFKANDKEYNYTLKDLGVSINKDELVNKILTYTNDYSYIEKVKIISNKEKTEFSYRIVYSEEALDSFLKELKSKVDCKVIEGKISVDSSHNVTYVKGTPSFSLNISKTKELILDNISSIDTVDQLELIGDVVEPKYTNLSTINKKISTYTTKFNHLVSRGKNLSNAAAKLNGMVLQPGETFSFYKAVGPYGTSNGYVYFENVVGNGICQVASTMYNVELLAGLKTVERYSHEKQMSYVPGGLDATVAATSFGPKVDFKFKNTYKYPIYIDAYTKEGELTISFWSNENATEGKTYKTESNKIGYKGYNTYLITYKDGKQISKNFIATTWYLK